jgi:hypothetical protein
VPTKNHEYEERLIWNGESGGKIEDGKLTGLRLDMPVEFGGGGRYPCRRTIPGRFSRSSTVNISLLQEEAQLSNGAL